MNSNLWFFVIFPLSAITSVSSSAIPMWEFLSRSEKMNHVYNTFEKQVSKNCKSSDMPDCNKVLLVYGLTNLAEMDDEHLDKIDPYQRGADEIIWESMTKGNNFAISESTISSQDGDSDSFDSNTFENYLGSASNNVEEISSSTGYPTGPMVVRVLMDGSPVPEEKSSPLKDEDIEEHFAMRTKAIPSIYDVVKQYGEFYSLPSKKFSFK